MPHRRSVWHEAAAKPGLIVPYAGYPVLIPAPGTFNVSATPRYQVDVAMKDGLPGHVTRVHADVEALDCTVGSHDLVPLPLDQAVAGVEMLSAKIDLNGHMAPRDHQ